MSKSEPLELDLGELPPMGTMGCGALQPVPGWNPALPPVDPGTKVRFKAHGETGQSYTVITRECDDCELCAPNGRILTRVPIELLVLAPLENQPPSRCWREVDELEAL